MRRDDKAVSTELGRLFHRIARQHSEQMLEGLATKGHGGLTLFHTKLIMNLDKQGTRLTVLADRAGMSKQSMSQVATDLETRNYIKRVKDKSDSRAFLIQFTPLGEKLLADAREVKEVVEANYKEKLSQTKVEALREMLQTLLLE